MGTQDMKRMEMELTRLQKETFCEDKPYVFISYSHNDKERVYPFVMELIKRGVNVSMDTEYKWVVKSWLKKMCQRLEDEHCTCMLAFFSENYIVSFPSLVELMYRYSNDVMENHWNNIELKPLRMLPISMFDTLNIRKQVRSLTSSMKREEEALDISIDEWNGFLDGIRGRNGVMRDDCYEPSNGYWKDRIKDKKSISSYMSRLIIDKEKNFDNCRSLGQIDDIIETMQQECNISLSPISSFDSLSAMDFGFRSTVTPAPSHISSIVSSPVTTSASSPVAVTASATVWSSRQELDLNQIYDAKAIQIGDKTYNVPSPKSVLLKVIALLCVTDKKLARGVTPAGDQGYYQVDGRIIVDMKKDGYQLFLEERHLPEQVKLFAESVEGAEYLEDYEKTLVTKQSEPSVLDSTVSNTTVLKKAEPQSVVDSNKTKVSEKESAMAKESLLSYKDFVEYLTSNKAKKFREVFLVTEGTSLEGIQVSGVTLREFYKKMIVAFTNQFGTEYLEELYEDSKNNKTPTVVSKVCLDKMEATHKTKYTVLEGSDDWYVFTNLSNFGYLDKIRARIREQSEEIMGFALNQAEDEVKIYLTASQKQETIELKSAQKSEKTQKAQKVQTVQTVQEPERKKMDTEKSFEQTNHIDDTAETVVKVEVFSDIFKRALTEHKRICEEKNKEQNSDKKATAIEFKNITLMYRGCEKEIRITNQKWKPLFKQMMEAFYEEMGYEFYEYYVEIAESTHNAEPYVISDEFYETQLKDVNKKHYQKVAESSYWFRNWYGVDKVLEMMMKWMERRNDYLDIKGNSMFTLDDYMIGFEVEEQFRSYFTS